MATVNKSVELDLEPDAEKGEVLLDSLAREVFNVEKFARKKHFFYLQDAVP